MNYLSHIFLSGNDGGLQVGNFIGDFVKGRPSRTFPECMRRGIYFHREIDSFTDKHPVVIEMKNFMRPFFGRYSGIVADMYFDYFLASDFEKYSEKSLRKTAYGFYFSVLLRYYYLPQRVKQFIFHFVFTNRLQQYSHPEGLYNSLAIMSRHKIPALNPDQIIDFLFEYYDTLNDFFDRFFPDMVSFASLSESRRCSK